MMKEEELKYPDKNQVQYYFMEEKKSYPNQFKKAKQFIKQDCIQQVSNFHWLVKPIKGNSLNYFIEYDGANFDCDCQWKVKQKKECSHIMAVKMFRRMKGIK